MTIPPPTASATTTMGGARQTVSNTNATNASAKSGAALTALTQSGIVQRRQQQPDTAALIPSSAERAGALRLRSSQNGSAPITSRKTAGTPHEAQDGGAPAADGGAKIRRESEQRSGHSLGGAVAGQELVIADPPRRHHLRLQQRQHDMAAAKHQRARAVEGIEMVRAGRARRCSSGNPASKRKNSDGRDPTRRDTGSPSVPSLVAPATRQTRQPATPPATMTRSGAMVECTSNISTAAAAAIVARSRSGASVRAIFQTACATMATATSFSPCSTPCPTEPPRNTAP